VNDDWWWFGECSADPPDFLNELQQWSGVFWHGLVWPLLEVEMKDISTADFTKFSTLVVEEIQNRPIFVT